MDTLREILQEIKKGTTAFEPASSADSDMEDFQAIAKTLIFADDEGLLEKCIPHKESMTSHGWYDLVLVNGGLSYKGEKFLAQVNDGANEPDDEIIQLKPTIYGIGIDLKAAWKRWKNRKR